MNLNKSLFEWRFLKGLKKLSMVKKDCQEFSFLCKIDSFDLVHQQFRPHPIQFRPQTVPNPNSLKPKCRQKQTVAMSLL